MEDNDLLDFEATLSQKKILVTGHTGFTGGWICTWLDMISSDIAGYALAPISSPNLFDALSLDQSMKSMIGDIRDFDKVLESFERVRPDAVIHLAAQPLVRSSYRNPLETFAINAQGTAHVLEAARETGVKAVVCVTTDKVYANQEWDWPYREIDPLGGKDPYSASKAAAEMIIGSYMSSFPHSTDNNPAIASARGGNIIGGGDWSEDRLVPDYVRAVTTGEKLTLRYPDATRPWQHVLALCHGYLRILAGLLNDPASSVGAWNLGPSEPTQYSVREIFSILGDTWARPELNFMDNPLHEAGSLALDSSLARNNLHWYPPWNTEQVVKATADWYRTYYSAPSSANEMTRKQINTWRTEIR